MTRPLTAPYFFGGMLGPVPACCTGPGHRPARSGRFLGAKSSHSSAPWHPTAQIEPARLVVDGDRSSCRPRRLVLPVRRHRETRYVYLEGSGLLDRLAAHGIWSSVKSAGTGLAPARLRSHGRDRLSRSSVLCRDRGRPLTAEQAEAASLRPPACTGPRHRRSRAPALCLCQVLRPDPTGSNESRAWSGMAPTCCCSTARPAQPRPAAGAGRPLVLRRLFPQGERRPRRCSLKSRACPARVLVFDLHRGQ